jgi:hypothetical protein
MAVTIVVGAIILWIVPIFVVNASGPKGRSGAAARGYRSRFRVAPVRLPGRTSSRS